ncbi:MAG: hypothetical protein ACI9B8_003585, partial [Sulfitobacter sp.]
MRDPDTNKEAEVQQNIEAGVTTRSFEQGSEQGPDAAADQTLFQGLERNVGSAPAGFSFRVMDRIIRIRVRTAEKQAKRLSLFLSAGLALLAAAGLGLSVWFGWLSADWMMGLPLVHLVAAIVSVLLLV